MGKNVLSRNPIFLTEAIARAAENINTAGYLSFCLKAFFSGFYGDICRGDVKANAKELDAYEGQIVARYKKTGSLREDIYIIAHFSRINPVNLDLNNTLILYVTER